MSCQHTGAVTTGQQCELKFNKSLTSDHTVRLMTFNAQKHCENFCAIAVMALGTLYSIPYSCKDDSYGLVYTAFYITVATSLTYQDASVLAVLAKDPPPRGAVGGGLRGVLPALQQPQVAWLPDGV